MVKKIVSKSYIFIDESGKPEVFSRKGTNLVSTGNASKYLVIVAVRTTDHLLLQQTVTECRLKMLKDPILLKIFSPAYSLNSFHAQTDYLEVKEIFYEWIKNCSLNLKITATVAEKIKAYESLQRNAGQLYSVVAGELLKRILHVAGDIDVIFSRKDASLNARETMNNLIENMRVEYATMNNLNFKTAVKYQHNPHYSHCGLQIADYVAHAIFKVLENGDRRWYNVIRNRISYIQDIFNKKSYDRKNPL